MHFYDVTLTAKKPLPEAYPKTLKTIGDHLRKKRLNLKLFQKDVAKILGVKTDTVTNWEKNHGSLALRYIPKIIEFLGYDPFPKIVTTLEEKIKQYRQKRGLSIKKLATILDVDPYTLARWESGEALPSRVVKNRLNGFFAIIQ